MNSALADGPSRSGFSRGFRDTPRFVGLATTAGSRAYAQRARPNLTTRPQFPVANGKGPSRMALLASVAVGPGAGGRGA